MIQKSGTIASIRNVLIIIDGVLLFDYGNERFNNQDFQLISGFISALDSFSSEVTKSVLNSIELDNYTFSLFRHENFKKLIFIIISEKESKIVQITCKLRKIASIFIKKYEGQIKNFSGDISLYEEFKRVIEQNNLLKYNCGTPEYCMKCPYAETGLKFNAPIPRNLRESISIIDSLTEKYSKKLDGLVDFLVLDTQGNVFNKKRVIELNQIDYEIIYNNLFPLIKNQYRENQNTIESGHFSLSEHQIFYASLSIHSGITLCFIFNVFEDIGKFLPILYPITNQLSFILNGYKNHIVIPEIINSSLIVRKSKLATGNTNKTIYFLGDSNVGKTSLLNLIFFGEELNNYMQTLGISIYEKLFEISRKLSINFKFIDFSGERRFLKVRKAIYNSLRPNILLIVFDSSKVSNLEGTNEWIEEIQFFTESNSIPILLVGNKIDLLTNKEETKQKVKRMVKELGNRVVFTSTRSYEGIEELFSYLTSNL